MHVNGGRTGLERRHRVGIPREGYVVLGLVPVVWLLTASAARSQAAAAEVPTRPAMEADARPRILSNDNRHPAGRLRDGVLTLRLEARDGLWYPEGPEGMARPVAAFGEVGKPLQNPGPLIRVPVGTEVRVTVHNTLATPLTLHGLGEERGITSDSVTIEPDGVREMTFTAREPGTYWYAGRTTSPPRLYARRGVDSQLNGVIVVDPPGATPRTEDRIFVISWWIRDPTVTSRTGPGTTLVINGLSWPHTERFDIAQGDSIHWRWVSMTGAAHPMHLHGFYFRVDGKGDGGRYTTYSPQQRRKAVTETLLAGETMQIAWSPSRPGNWLFHCHVARHMAPDSELEEEGSPPAATKTEHAGQHSAHAHAMARLVLGIHVRPRGEPAAPPSREPRRMRLLIRSRPAAPGAPVRYGYVLGGSPEEADPSALPLPGPALILEKDEPVAITVVNQSHEPAAVHWHGIELESFPDGVPGWSGSGTSLLPAIPPHDSLTVRFTPPRAGTFMYHSHFNELRQIASGLYGPIIVLEPGQRYDPETDRVLLFSDGWPSANAAPGARTPALLNGRALPEPMELRAGTTYRFRLINIRSNALVAMELLDGDGPVEWRHVAKDGADLPASQAIVGPGRLAFGVGEVHDVEFTPRAPGDLTLRYGFPGLRPIPPLTPPPAVVTVRVR